MKIKPTFIEPRTMVQTMKFQRVKYHESTPGVIRDRSACEVEDWDIEVASGFKVPLVPFSELISIPFDLWRGDRGRIRVTHGRTDLGA